MIDMGIKQGIFWDVSFKWQWGIENDAVNLIIRTSFTYLDVSCYCRIFPPTTMLITSKNWKIESKINGIMKKIKSTTWVLIIDRFKKKILLRKITYHSVALNRFKTQSQNT